MPRPPQPSALDSARDRLLRAAIELIATRGYREAAAAEISARAGVTSEEFHELFAGKEDCLRTALDEAVDEAIRRVRNACHTAPASSPGVSQAVASLLAYLTEEPNVAQACVVEQFEARPNAQRQRDLVLETFTRMLENAQRRGRFRREPNPLLSEAAVGGLYHVISQRVRREGPGALTGLAPELTHAVAVMLGREDLLG